jgi:hypothetical protein
VSIGLLEGLEADDISRWPGGIFRRAFVRSYAECVGLDPDDVVKRFERQHLPPDAEVLAAGATPVVPVTAGAHARTNAALFSAPPQRARLLGTAADLTVAVVLAFASAAAGSRLLWPVLLIAAYYAVGVLLTGTSPMVALLTDAPVPSPEPRPLSAAPAAEQVPAPQAAPARAQARRTNERPRQRRGAQARA